MIVTDWCLAKNGSHGGQLPLPTGGSDETVSRSSAHTNTASFCTFGEDTLSFLHHYGSDEMRSLLCPHLNISGQHSHSINRRIEYALKSYFDKVGKPEIILYESALLDIAATKKGCILSTGPANKTGAVDKELEKAIQGSISNQTSELYTHVVSKFETNLNHNIDHLLSTVRKLCSSGGGGNSFALVPSETMTICDVEIGVRTAAWIPRYGPLLHSFNDVIRRVSRARNLTLFDIDEDVWGTAYGDYLSLPAPYIMRDSSHLRQAFTVAAANKLLRRRHTSSYHNTHNDGYQSASAAATAVTPNQLSAKASTAGSAKPTGVTVRTSPTTTLPATPPGSGGSYHDTAAGTTGRNSYYLLVQASDCEEDRLGGLGAKRSSARSHNSGGVTWRPAPSSLSKGSSSRKPLQGTKTAASASASATVAATNNASSSSTNISSSILLLNAQSSQCAVYFSTVRPSDGVRVRYTQPVTEELLKYLHLGVSDVYRLPRQQLENLTEVTSIPTFEKLEVCASEYFCTMTTKTGRKFLIDNTYYVRIAVVGVGAGFSTVGGTVRSAASATTANITSSSSSSGVVSGGKTVTPASANILSMTHGFVGAIASFLDIDDEWIEYIPLEDHADSIIPKAGTTAGTKTTSTGTTKKAATSDAASSPAAAAGKGMSRLSQVTANRISSSSSSSTHTRSAAGTASATASTTTSNRAAAPTTLNTRTPPPPPSVPTKHY